MAPQGSVDTASNTDAGAHGKDLITKDCVLFSHLSYGYAPSRLFVVSIGSKYIRSLVDTAWSGPSVYE
jgi:hypothetical protein